MKLLDLRPDQVVLSDDMSRSSTSKQFEVRLQASIDQIGLAEPLKVAPLPTGKYLVVDGTMRWRAISAIRGVDQSRFATVPAYVVDYDRRFELRYQTDIYQDLLPSQLASLVEHLHQQENIKKTEIARYIGVSPATLRNYTGLWRLLQRRGLFARVVELMDVGVIPASNPYAWLRLTPTGIRLVIEESFADGQKAELWIKERVRCARAGDATSYPIKFIEIMTGSLLPEYYREATEVRTLKRDLGLRRGATNGATPTPVDLGDALKNLTKVRRRSSEPVLRSAATSLKKYLDG